MNIKDLPHQHRRKKEPPPIDWLRSSFTYNPTTGSVSRCGSAEEIRTKMKRPVINVRYNGVVHGVRKSRLAFVLMTGRWPAILDHINGDSSDDRWENLREVTQADNSKNKAVSKHSKTKVPGVFWEKERNCWKITICNKTIGRFHDLWEAICLKKAEELKRGFHENHGRP